MAEQPEIRAFDDTAKAREFLYSNMLNALQSKSGYSDGKHRLEIADVRLAGPKEYSLSQQKKALISGRSLRTPVKARLKLIDEATNSVVDEKEERLFSIPYYTDRGTIIHKGNEYTVANQSRLKPGTYTRVKRTGEYETQFNVKPGTGAGFKMWMEPSTGLFKVNMKQSNIPAHYLLRAMGVTDEEMRKSWGDELYEQNIKKKDSKALDKLYERLVFKSLRNPDATDKEKQEAIKEAMSKSEVDPWVIQKNMGLEGVTNIDSKLLLRATNKLVGVSRGEESVDDRDAPAFSTVHGIEDFLPERVEKDAGDVLKTLMWKTKRNGTLEAFKSGIMNPYSEGFILNSGLTQPGEETNVVSTMDQAYRITKMGLGGLPSDQAVTDEARAVNPNQVGFIDLVSGPECFDGLTEVYTVEGWKYWPDVTEDDYLLCDIDGVKRFRRPNRLIAEHYEGPMYEVKGVANLLVTAGHDLKVKEEDKYVKKTAKFVYDYLNNEHGAKYYLDLSPGPIEFDAPVDAIPVDSVFADEYYYHLVTGDLLYRSAHTKPCSYDTETEEGQERYLYLLHSLNVNAVKERDEIYVITQEMELTKDLLSVTQFSGKVYCAEVPGNLLYVRRGQGTSGVWTGNSTRIGIDVRASYKTYKGRDKRLYADFIDMDTGKKTLLSPEQTMSATVAFPGEDLSDPNNTVFALVDGKMKKVKAADVQYQIPSLSHMSAPTVNLTNMPTGYMASRLFYNSKYQSQFMPVVEGEAPLVQTLVPDGSGRTFSEYYGKKIGTLNTPVDAKVERVTSKNIELRGTDGKKYFIETVKNFPFNRLTGISYEATVKPGDIVKAGSMVARSNFTDAKGALNSGRNLRTVINPAKGHAFEDAYVISDTAAKKLTNARLYGFSEEARFGKQLSRKNYVSAFPNKFTNEQLDKVDNNGVVKKGTIIKKGDPVILATGPKVLSAEDAKLGKLHKVLRNTYRDEATVWNHDYDGVVTDVHHGSSGASVYIKAEVPVKVGDKLVNGYSSKGVVGKIIPEEEMPRDAKTGKPYEVVFNPMAVPSRVAPNQIIEAKLAKIAKITGKPYKITAEPPPEGWLAFVEKEMKKHGISDAVDIYDPQTGKTIPQQSDGVMYISPFHHLAEKKLCLTPDTEVKTKSGWKPIAEVKPGEEVECLVDGKAVWQQAEAAVEYIVDGEPLYHVEDEDQDLIGTGCHRFVVSGTTVRTGEELFEMYH